MSRRYLCLAAIVSAVAIPLSAQTGDDDENDPTTFLRPSFRFLSLDFETGTVFDTNIDQNDAEIQSNGLVARAIFEARKDASSRVFRFRYIGDAQTYSRSDRWDRSTSDVTGMYYERLSRQLTVTTIGGYALRGPSEEQLPADQFSGWSQLRYRPSRAAEIAVYASYRWVRPEDDQFDENVLTLGAELGGSIGRTSLWEIGYRREQSDSPSASRRYHTDRLRAEYAVLLGRGTSLGARLEHAYRVFPEVTTDFGVSRARRRWIPSAFWIHRFDSGKRLTFRWQYQERSTNYGRGGWHGHRVDALLRIPLVSPRRSGRRGPSDRGAPWPLPGLPDDVPTAEPPILEQLRYLSARPALAPPLGVETVAASDLTFTRGSHWKEVLSAQGVPTGVTERPHFFEDRWHYGASWVVFRGGRVVDWHDAGNLKLRSESVKDTEAVAATERLAFPVAAPRTQGAASAGMMKFRESDEEESISMAFVRAADPEIVLIDGTRMKGVLRKCENGLAHVLLFLENDRTLLATMPEDLIDKDKSSSSGP